MTAGSGIAHSERTPGEMRHGMTCPEREIQEP
jgi:redox-sensitive bicupin YhaK (pirin superfamily)